MSCSSCGHENPSLARVCLRCGAALALRCPGCQVELPTTAKFCLECGTPVVQGESASRALALASADTDVARLGERRQLTVLFCDLVGSTPLAQQLDAEDWREVLAQYHAAAAGAVARWGGHVAKNLGDGLLVYFGWPSAREDDPERAIRAGLAMIEAMAPLNATLGAADGTRLAVRIGMDTGAVVIADDGEVFGETVNVASRVQNAAEPDTVVITAATQRLVAGIFAIEACGPQVLRGVLEPITLYRVVQPSGVRSRLAAAAGRLTPFVGRELELARLAERWEQARDGAGQKVIVLGEAGIGKSRLVYQLRERLAAVPHTWLECGATPYTAGTPFHPVIALVAQGLAFAPEDTAAEKLAKVERGLGGLATAEAVTLLADLVGLPPPTRLQLSPELQRRKTIELLAQWTLAISAVQPLVLLVEDLHWCDPSSLELLGHLVAQSRTARLLLVVTARPEFTPPWPAGDHMTTLPLTRLGEREARDMVMTLAGEALPVATLDALVTRADGVPLYVEELTRSVVEPGTARSVEAIPATLADSLMGRLDRLSTAKEVAQRAAVLGREFAYPLLTAVAGLEEAGLRHGLARLVEAEIVFARGEPPEATYTFKHALVQEAAYGSLLKRTRQQLHARIARVLEERFPDRVASEPEVIARHYDQAGLVTPAIAHYQRAGERATQRWANEEAIGHLRHALALLGTLPETRERNQRELVLQMAIGAPLSAARGWSNPDYEGVFVRARALASQIGDSPELPRVLEGMGAAYLMKGDLTTAVEIGSEALAAAERTGAVFDLLLAHVSLGTALAYQGHFTRGVEHLEQAIALYDPSRHAAFAYALGFDRGAAAHSHAANCQSYLGHLDRALALSERGVALARRVDHPLSLAIALLQNGVVHFERGEFDPMAERIGELVHLAEQLGFPFWLGVGLFFRGFARVESGEGEAGIAEMQQALVDLARLGNGLGAPAVLVVLARSLWKVGRHGEALGALDLGFAQAEQQSQHYVDAELHRLRGEILLDKNGDTAEEAESHFGQGLEVARQQQAKLFELRAAMRLVSLWQRRGKRDQARALLTPVYAWFTEGFDTRDLKDARTLLDGLG